MPSTAPKRRLDVRQQTPARSAGKRAAQRRATRRRVFRPTPAMAGAFALILAGFGSAVAGGQSDGDTLAGDRYQTISASYTGNGDGADSSSNVDISRDFDRDLLEKQAETQAKQREKALAELAEKTQQRADEQKGQWVLPVAGYRLTARFGQRSSLWSSGSHTGLDFAGPSGSTIVSVAAGTVKSTGYEGSYGNRTVITLDDGTGTEIWYCHQSRIAVTPGQKVDPGQVIGYTGSTGNTTGPHLHLEVHPGGSSTAVDPIPVLVQHGIRP